MRIPLRGRMSAVTIAVNCSSLTGAACDIKETGGTTVVCADSNNVCTCDATTYSDTSNTKPNTECVKTNGGLTCATFDTKEGCAITSACAFDDKTSKCICDASKNFVASGNDCVCNATAHFVLNTNNTACVCDEKNGFKPDASAGCACDTNYVIEGGKCTCPSTGFKVVKVANTPDACVEIEKAPCAQIDAADCKDLTSCKVDSGKCVCADGYTSNDTSKLCEKNNSSASPLAILIICSLIISIIASIATAAVMIRRKANNARAAEAIVSDAL